MPADGLPLHQFQVEHEDGVNHGNQQQGHKGGDTQAADLRVTHRLPQRPAVRGQRKEREHRGADRDHHRPQPHNPRVQQRLAQRSASFARFFDEVEEHDDVADDHAHQAHATEEGHKAERRSHHPQRRKRAYHPEGNRREHDQGFDRVLELKDQRQEDGHDGDQQHDRQVHEALHLFFLFAADLHFVAGRQRGREGVQLFAQRAHHFRRQRLVFGKARDRDGSELIPAPKFFGLHLVFDRRNHAEWNAPRPLRGIDVEVVDVGELRALLHSQPRDDGNLLVALAQIGYPLAADRGGRGGGDVVIGDAGEIRAVGVGPQPDGEAFVAPIVADARRERRFAENVFDPFGLGAQASSVVARNPDRHRQPYGFTRFELAHVNARPRDLRRQGFLQRLDQMPGVVFVIDLNDYLRVIELLQFGRDGGPEARAAAADERRQRSQHVGVFMLLAVFFDLSADHFFGAKGGLVRRGERRVFRQPHVYVGEMRQILREE